MPLWVGGVIGGTLLLFLVLSCTLTPSLELHTLSKTWLSLRSESIWPLAAVFWAIYPYSRPGRTVCIPNPYLDCKERTTYLKGMLKPPSSTRFCIVYPIIQTIQEKSLRFLHTLCTFPLSSPITRVMRKYIFIICIRRIIVYGIYYANRT